MSEAELKKLLPPKKTANNKLNDMKSEKEKEKIISTAPLNTIKSPHKN